MKNKIKGLYGNVTLVGELVYNTDKFYTSGKSGNYVYHRVGLGVKTSDSNVIFAELMGGYDSVKPYDVKTLDKNNNKLEISWSNRSNPKIVGNVADFKKLKVNFMSTNEKDSNVFLAEYDTVEYIKNNIKPNLRVVMQCQLRIDRFKGDDGWIVSKKYVIQKIRLAKDDEENKADATISFVFDKDSWDKGRLKEDKKIDVTGYYTAYHKPTKSNVFVPLSFVLDVSKIDFDNPKHNDIFKFYESCFSAKRGEYYETQWHCSILRGAEEEEFTEDMLTAEQKLQIDLGICTFEDVKRDMRGGGIKNKVDEIRLIRPTNKFEGTANLLTIYEEDDFYIAEDENFEDIMNGLNGTSDDNLPKDNDEDLINSLFGGESK